MEYDFQIDIFVVVVQRVLSFANRMACDGCLFLLQIITRQKKTKEMKVARKLMSSNKNYDTHFVYI